jgi:endonuclease YncB( thermonuclease family)
MLVALAVLAAIGALRYGVPDLPIDLPITPEQVAASPTGTIAGRASVIDGDTIEIHGESIRLLDIDAPESKQLCTADDGTEWRCGREAAFALQALLGQKTVTCVTQKKDRYRRWLARCSVSDVGVAEWMAGHGWAVPYRDCGCEEIRAASELARQQHVGIWSSVFVMPWEWRKAH